ncbi:GH11472 [Drosophila grimshawi]|uniref:GH11472 n=1 Tax=Drosophila grimshawi TaxID=7222 RepID=B4JAQ4_DROGR|nr:GH11472 [Drosophila grimshawi]
MKLLLKELTRFTTQPRTFYCYMFLSIWIFLLIADIAAFCTTPAVPHRARITCTGARWVRFTDFPYYQPRTAAVLWANSPTRMYRYMGNAEHNASPGSGGGNYNLNTGTANSDASEFASSAQRFAQYRERCAPLA